MGTAGRTGRHAIQGRSRHDASLSAGACLLLLAFVGVVGAVAGCLALVHLLV